MRLRHILAAATAIAGHFHLDIRVGRFHSRAGDNVTEQLTTQSVTIRLSFGEAGKDHSGRAGLVALREYRGDHSASLSVRPAEHIVERERHAPRRGTCD